MNVICTALNGTIEQSREMFDGKLFIGEDVASFLYHLKRP